MDLLAPACRATAALLLVPVFSPRRLASAGGLACSGRIGGAMTPDSLPGLPGSPANDTPRQSDDRAGAIPRGRVRGRSPHRPRARKLRLQPPAATEARGGRCAGGHEFLRWYVHSDGSPISLGPAC